MQKKQEYNADNINVLEGLSAIRKRPGMYIGDVGERGLHHCVYEVVDNSTDEAVAGYGKVIKLTKLKNGGIRVEDEGRGIPVEKKENGISAATITLTVLHAGGKFDKDTYKVSGGLHGIGIKATNATSKWLKVTICRNGEQWEQEFEKGVPLYDIKQTGVSKKTGTTLEFIPDDSIFDNVIYNSEILKNRLRNSSFLTKNVEFIYIDEETKEKESFLSLNGLEDMISYQIEPENILTPVMSFSGSDEKRGFLKDKDTGKEDENGILEKFDLEVSFLYENGYKTTISSFVNKILTPGGGVHEQGVLDALSSGILKKVKEAKVVSKKDKEIISKVNLEDVKEGLVLAISLSVYTDIIFEGQTKDKLSGVHLRAMIRNLAKDKIETYLNANPVITNKIVQKVITSRKARESAERARKTERKQQTEEIGSMLGKLTDCRSNNPEECELFIVEGQSAGGTAKQGRDGKYQAILPLKGKPINPLKSVWADVIANDEILSLKTALGCGMGDNIDLSKLRYHKIINQTDADIDGSHIQQLLLTIYNTLFKPLLEAGYIYRAVPPLHRVKIGKEPFYLNTDKDKNDYILKITEEETKKIKSSKKYKELFSIDKEKLDELDIRLKEIDKLLSLEYSDKLSIEKSNLLNLKNNFKSVIFFNSELKSSLSKYVFNRFKGLGEMNPEQLAETTMDPKTRQLIQLKPDKLYDLSDVINTDDFGNNSLSNILSIVERRKEEKKLKKEKHPVKDSLVDLTIDNIIGLISSDKGKEFRKIYLMRNIIGSEIGD